MAWPYSPLGRSTDLQEHVGNSEHGWLLPFLKGKPSSPRRFRTCPSHMKALGRVGCLGSVRAQAKRGHWGPGGPVVSGPERGAWHKLPGAAGQRTLLVVNFWCPLLHPGW